MTRTVITMTVALAALAAAALTANAASTSAPPCTPKTGKLNGQPIVYECGPATATLHAGGKTFSFHDGFCQASKSSGLALEINLGTLAPMTKGNAGKPYFDLTGAKIGGTVSAHYGGKLIANNLVSISGRFPTQGTFKSKFSGAGPGQTFSGSWNCHGAVWQAP